MKMTRYILNKFLISTITLLLSVTLLCGCFEKKLPTELTFQPLYKNMTLSCESNFRTSDSKNIKVGEQKSWQYQQLQFYIHGVEVKTEENGWQPWQMTTNPNQASNVALLGEICNENTEASNWQLELVYLDYSANITDIRFTLGVPFELNHLNPLTQPSPINDSSMFWGWRGGHKFMRVELVSQDDDWLFHLGSIGCKASSPVRAPKTECLYPNRVSVSLPFTDQTSAINFDLAVLLHDIALTRENSCQSAVDEESCKTLFKNLGMATDSKNKSLLFKAQKNG
jgi:uncharacterized repeat protein (TIGR04052 family)